MPEEKKKVYKPKPFSTCIKEFFDKLHGLRFDHFQMQNIENCANDLIELGNWFVETHGEWWRDKIEKKELAEGETFKKMIKTYIEEKDNAKV